MLRPVVGLWESHLERALLRRSVGAMRDAATRCADCARTPLVGERVHHFEGAGMVCELCRPGRGGDPIRVERVHHAEHGATVKLRKRPA